MWSSRPKLSRIIRFAFTVAATSRSFLASRVTHQRETRIAVEVLLACVLAAACGGAPSAPSDSLNGATLTVSVVSASTPIPFVTVTLAGANTANATTDAFGKATFPNLPAGNYAISVHGFGIEDATTSVAVSSASVQTTLEVRYKNDVALVSTPKECGTTIPSPLNLRISVQYRLASPVPGHGAAIQYGLSADGMTYLEGGGYATSDNFASESRTLGFINVGFIREPFVAHFLIVQLVAADIDRFNVHLVSVLATQVSPCELTVTPQ